MSETELTLLMMGPTGSGKSLTGNVLTQQDAFVVSGSIDSQTRECRYAETSYGRFLARVIDAAGGGDTEMTEKQRLAYLAEFVDLSPGGLDIVLFTISARRRWDQLVQACLRQYSAAFGDETIIPHTVLVVTECGPDPARKEQEIRNSRTFPLVADYFGGGAVFVENEAPGTHEKLWNHISCVVERNGYQKWSNAAFLEARDFRNSVELAISKLPDEMQDAPRAKLSQLLHGEPNVTRQNVVQMLIMQQIVLEAQRESYDLEDLLQQSQRQVEDHRRLHDLVLERAITAESANKKWRVGASVAGIGAYFAGLGIATLSGAGAAGAAGAAGSAVAAEGAMNAAVVELAGTEVAVLTLSLCGSLMSAAVAASDEDVRKMVANLVTRLRDGGRGFSEKVVGSGGCLSIQAAAEASGSNASVDRADEATPDVFLPLAAASLRPADAFSVDSEGMEVAVASDGAGNVDRPLEEVSPQFSPSYRSASELTGWTSSAASEESALSLVHRTLALRGDAR